MSESHEWIADIYLQGKRLRFSGRTQEEGSRCYFSVSPLATDGGTTAVVHANLHGRLVEYVDSLPPNTEVRAAGPVVP